MLAPSDKNYESGGEVARTDSEPRHCVVGLSEVNWFRVLQSQSSSSQLSLLAPGSHGRWEWDETFSSPVVFSDGSGVGYEQGERCCAGIADSLGRRRD